MGETDQLKSIFQPFRKVNPSAEYLLGMIIEYRAIIEQYRLRYKDKEKDEIYQKMLDLCEHKINEAEQAVLVTGLFKRKIFTAWDLFHQVAADLILCMDEAELAAYGRKLTIDIKASSLPETIKTDSILHLNDSQKKLQDAKAENKKEVVPEVRQALRTVTFTLNTHVDSIFWDIWTRKFICLIYTAVLLLLLLVFLGLYDKQVGSDCIRISWVVLIGAMGGLLSGIFSGEIQSVAKGHFWVSILYYSLVRPIQGALAATAVFWMLQSEYLIKITPPLDEGNRTFSCLSTERVSPAALAMQPHSSVKQKAAAFSNHSGEKKAEHEEKASVIVLDAAKGKQIYLYLLVLLLAGFSGDKILKSISDKVTGRLFTEAEKTKEAKKD